MEVLFNAVGGLIVEVGKCMCKCIYPKIENTVRFSSKIENLREEMENLKELRDDIKGKLEGEEQKGYKPKPDVIRWIEDVRELENTWATMQGSIAAAKKLAYKCCPNCSLRSEVSTQVARNIRDELCKLKEVRENFGSSLLVENYRMERVEYIPVTSIEGQAAATRNLNAILQFLENDKVCIIGVWGTGGIGKTTLVKNLNNELKKTDVLSSKLSFGVVIWVTVPKPPIDISNVQAQIANRLNLEVDNKGSVERSAYKICQRLKEEKSFLLILDDVWEAINLDNVGVPQPEDSARSKVIITSRFMDVCREMKTDTKMKVYTLDEDESWKLFVKNAGDSANLEHIQPLAKEIARECDGLPLAIAVIGTSMRGKTMVELWEDALKSLRMFESRNKAVKDKVYNVIKWSFDSLESHIQSCFLYCSLYPADIPTDDVIHCWWAEGFLGEHDTYEEAYNRGITMIESLKDACLLEEDEMESVKMHDVVRDVAKWIANSPWNEHNSVFQAGIGLTEISHIKVSTSVKRISFVSNYIERLSDNFTECPETTSLLLQDNYYLEEIPHDFILAFPALRVLNLSHTGIGALPSSINKLCQLRALILQYCIKLEELPPIGDLCNLQVLDCFNTELDCLPQGMDKLTDLRLLNMWGSRSSSFDEISSLHKLTALVINLDSSSISNRDLHSCMKRLKTFHIEIGEYPRDIPFNKSTRTISVSNCEIFSNGELLGMLEFASHLYLGNFMGLRKLIANKSFNRLKTLEIMDCSCDLGAVEEGSRIFDPLPNLEFLDLYDIDNLKSVSDFGHFLGLRFSELRKLNVFACRSLTCLFNVGGAFPVPKNLEDISISYCDQLVELFVQCSSSQATLVNTEIPRVRKLVLLSLPKLGTLWESQSMWEHLEELKVLHCNGIRKLPLSIQNSKNIKVIKGESEWWSQLEWDDNFKSNLEHCFTGRRIKVEVTSPEFLTI